MNVNKKNMENIRMQIWKTPMQQATNLQASNLNALLFSTGDTIADLQSESWKINNRQVIYTRLSPIDDCPSLLVCLFPSQAPHNHLSKEQVHILIIKHHFMTIRSLIRFKKIYTDEYQINTLLQQLNWHKRRQIRIVAAV